MPRTRTLHRSNTQAGQQQPPCTERTRRTRAQGLDDKRPPDHWLRYHLLSGQTRDTGRIQHSADRQHDGLTPLVLGMTHTARNERVSRTSGVEDSSAAETVHITQAGFGVPAYKLTPTGTTWGSATRAIQLRRQGILPSRCLLPTRCLRPPPNQQRQRQFHTTPGAAAARAARAGHSLTGQSSSSAQQPHYLRRTRASHTRRLPGPQRSNRANRTHLPGPTIPLAQANNATSTRYRANQPAARRRMPAAGPTIPTGPATLSSA